MTTDLEKIKKAIEQTANDYGGNGTESSDLICDALRKLLDNIEYQEQFGDADLEGDQAAHERGAR